MAARASTTTASTARSSLAQRRSLEDVWFLLLEGRLPGAQESQAFAAEVAAAREPARRGGRRAARPRQGVRRPVGGAACRALAAGRRARGAARLRPGRAVAAT
nr:citrate/2-methylcitrate synthase [Angustibacter aerolatus]